MTRALIAILLVLAPLPSLAAVIEGDLALACRDLELQRRIDRIAGSGDKEAVGALLKLALASRQCFPLPAGLRVRIEENSFPYACVVKFGTIGACSWVRQRHVNPKESD